MTPRLLVASRSAGLLGLVGTLTCTLAMTLPAIGAGAAGGMAAMSGASAPTQGGFLAFLLEYGPLILLVSIALVTLGLALRRPLAAVPALGAGAVLYWGMYAQASYVVRYVCLAFGSAVWAVIYRWTGSAQQSTEKLSDGQANLRRPAVPEAFSTVEVPRGWHSI